jgi:hypothetical protein
MDDALLEDRLTRIERRQDLILLLLFVPYLVGLGELIGYAISGVLVVGLAVVVVGVVVSRRRSRRTTEQ